ncbi:MAG: hypothetical protein ACOY5H_11405 [Pseudomonadota bacterium]
MTSLPNQALKWTHDPANPARKRVTDYVYAPNGLDLQSLIVRRATSGGAITRTFTYEGVPLNR